MEPEWFPKDVWLRRDKLRLLVALRRHGQDDVRKIQKYLPEKTIQEIRNKINTYKEKTQAHRNRKGIWPNSTFVDKWLTAIKNSCDSKLLCSDLPLALKIIAHLEAHPDPAKTSNIDLKKLYLYLAAAMEGSSLGITLNTETKQFLIQCIMSASRTVNVTPQVQEIDFINSVTRIFPNPNPELNPNEPSSSAIRTILLSAAYNPLGVPEDLTKKEPDNRSLEKHFLFYA